jgi:hypothetical protein
MSEFLRDFASSLQDAATNGGDTNGGDTNGGDTSGGDTSGGGTSGLLAGADAGLRPVPKNLDDATAAGLVDTTVDFGKGFAKGVAKTGSDIVDSPAGQLVNPTAPLEKVTEQGINALVSGDPGAFDPSKAFAAPSIGIDVDNPGAKFNDPREQQKAMAEATGLINSVVDPFGQQLKAGATTGQVLATGDPNQVGQAAGSSTVILGATVVGAGELGAGEVAVAEDGVSAPLNDPVPPAVDDPIPPKLGDPIPPTVDDPALASPPRTLQGLGPSEAAPPSVNDPALAQTERPPDVSPQADSVPSQPRAVIRVDDGVVEPAAGTQQTPQAAPISRLDPDLNLPDPNPQAESVPDPPRAEQPQAEPEGEAEGDPQARPDLGGRGGRGRFDDPEAVLDQQLSVEENQGVHRRVGRPHKINDTTKSKQRVRDLLKKGGFPGDDE